MITWIQRTFQRHTKLVFLFLLIVITIPFVFTIGAAPGIGRAGNKLNERPFFNVNLGNEEQANQLFTDGNLSAQLRSGSGSLQSAQIQQYALQRVAGLAVADELHLPAPTADQIAKFVATLRVFQNESGQFDQKRYTAFGDSLKSGKGLTIATVNRVLRDDARLDLLTKIVGGPGYVLPFVVQQQLLRSDANWTVQVAALPYAAFNPAITASEEILKKFYDENAFRYDVPVRPRISYVEFKSDEFLPPGNPTETELREFYQANLASFPAPLDSDKKDAAAGTDNFSKVRPQVEATLKKAVSSRLAAKAANELTVAIYNQKLAANSAGLTAFLAAQRRPAAAIAPFVPDTPPTDLPWIVNYADQIFRLNQEHFFSDPVQSPNGYVIFLWNESLPAYKPMYPEVHDRVAADYKEGEKRRLFIEHGRTLRAQLQAAAKTGPTGFNSAVAAGKLEVKSYANFTMRQPPQDLPYPAVSALQTLATGDVSEMIPTGEQGILVYAQEKKLPDLNPASLRYGELQKQLMLFTANTNENSFLGELVELELKKTTPAKP